MDENKYNSLIHESAQARSHVLHHLTDFGEDLQELRDLLPAGSPVDGGLSDTQRKLSLLEQDLRNWMPGNGQPIAQVAEPVVEELNSGSPVDAQYPVDIPVVVLPAAEKSPQPGEIGSAPGTAPISDITPPAAQIPSAESIAAQIPVTDSMDIPGSAPDPIEPEVKTEKATPADVLADEPPAGA